MLQIRNLHYSIGERNILSGISLSLNPGKKYILTGNNGTGKTTLLRIISGEIEPDSGTISKPGIFQTGYLPQEEINPGNLTVLQTVMEGKKDISRVWEKMEEIHFEMENASEDELNSLIKRLGILEHKFNSLDGYKLEIRSKSILSGLGFSTKDFTRSIKEFSGGWRMRAHLAMILIKDPDLLLLDEPTNHLDIPSMEWLEQYLGGFSGSVILVTHDRYFIDRIGGEIIELEFGKIIRYKGNYEEYESSKKERHANLEKKHLTQTKEIARQERFIERFRYKNTKASLVQSRIKSLEKIEIVEVPQSSSIINFRIESGIKSYKEVLNIHDLSFGYKKNTSVLNSIDMQMFRGEKSALIGINGSGKTTLTKLITGQLNPVEGNVILGEKVVVGYYAQHQTEALNIESTVLEEVSHSAADRLIPRIRDILGIFQFKGDDVFKRIKVLSGGEKARVSLAKILLSPVNFLIMDEPTTHLDKIAKKALQDSLTLYEGTLLLISHDRYFIDKIVDKIILLKNGSLTEYPGNYSYYLNKHAKKFNNIEKKANITEETVKSISGKKSKAQRRIEAEARQAVSAELNELRMRVEKLENYIEELESKTDRLKTEMSLPETYEDKTLTVSLQKEFYKKNKDLEIAYIEWEEAQEKIEKIRLKLI